MTEKTLERHCKRWTEKDDAELKRLYKSRNSLTNVAKKMQRSYGSINYRLVYLNLTVKKISWDAAEEQKLIIFYSTNMPVRKIAKALGKPEGSIKSKAIRMKLRRSNTVTILAPKKLIPPIGTRAYTLWKQEQNAKTGD